MRTEIPLPSASVELTMDDGAIIKLRRHGNPAGPRLALSHGNGMAIDGYYPFWKLLLDRYDLMLFDFRNHGQNPVHRLEDHTWSHFVLDLEKVFVAIQEHFGRKRTAGVFHSLAAVTATSHAGRFGARWDPLVLFDPPYYPPEGHPLRAGQFFNEEEIAARAEKRTPSYAAPSELADAFARRMTRWLPEAYKIMARATLRFDEATKEWVLACPREFEAKVFRSNRETDAWAALARVAVPVKLICGDPEAPDTSAPAILGRAIASESGVAYEAIAETSHFLQIERPEACIAVMEAFLRDQRFID